MPNANDIGDFVAGSRLKGNDWLLPHAKLAQELGKELSVFDDGSESFTIRVTDLETQKWLEIALDGSDDEDVERLIREFPDIYSQMAPIEDDEDNPAFAGESISNRIVDVLLESIDPDEFVGDFSNAEERVSGKPLNPVPTGKKLIRAVQLETGHKLYIWRTTQQREYYGSGPASFYLGYRFVAPSGLIIYEGSEFHPGGGYRGTVRDNDVLILIQSLVNGADDTTDEEIESMTPEQKAWLDDPARERIQMDVGGHDGFEEGHPAPWKDLPITARS